MSRFTEAKIETLDEPPPMDGIRLVQSCLLQAIMTLTSLGASPVSRKEQEFDWIWMFLDQSTQPFSYLWCCMVLDLDHQRLRRIMKTTVPSIQAIERRVYDRLAAEDPHAPRLRIARQGRPRFLVRRRPPFVPCASNQ